MMSAQLLLLPSPLAHDTSLESLQAAYGEAFTKLFSGIHRESGGLRRLDIALTYSGMLGATRSQSYEQMQVLFKLFYSLSCLIAVQANIDLDINDGLDIRIFMLKLQDNSESKADARALTGPVVDVETFVTSGRSYSHIYSVEGEEASSMLSSFSNAWQKKHHYNPDITRLICGPLLTSKASANGHHGTADHESIHKRVAVGGTFDHLHIGHKLLLTATVLLAEPNLSDTASSPRVITVGITTDALLVNKKYASLVEPWEVRQQKVAEFIESILVFRPDVSSIREVENIDNSGANGKVVRFSYGSELIINYTAISDGYGPTITDESISALVISHETRAGGKAVNDKRKQMGWNELEVFEVDVLDQSGSRGEAEGFESKISSTQIRKRLSEKEEQRT